MKKYTAKSLSKALREIGYDISARTINYYAYDKNMFSNLQQGKEVKENKDIVEYVLELINTKSMLLAAESYETRNVDNLERAFFQVNSSMVSLSEIYYVFT